MRQDPQRKRGKALQMNACSVAVESQLFLRQLSLPVDPTDTIKARRERAIARSGLSHSKGTRIWYGQPCAILAHEYLKLKAALTRYAETQERSLLNEIEQLRALRGAADMRERHGTFSFNEDREGVVEAPSSKAVDLVGVEKTPAAVEGG